MAQPRVAVVGGGIAGTLCSLVLKHRGVHPTIIDAGRRGLGGRLRQGGAQFLRASDPSLATVCSMLEQEGLLARWEGRFGVLGSSGGGFLPAEIITSSGIRRMRNSHDDDSADNQPSATGRATASDGGDFCHFADGSKVPTYVGVPSMADLCPGISRLAGIDGVGNARVISASPLPDGGWHVNVKGGDGEIGEEIFDGLVLATHDASLSSRVVHSIVDAEVAARREAATEGDNESVIVKLSQIADALQMVRDEGRMPVYTIASTYPRGFSQRIPFDAVSVPGSHLIQFLARDASKPSSDNKEAEGEVWTAISTSLFAAGLLSEPGLSDGERLCEASNLLSEEIARLLSPYLCGEALQPVKVSAKRWVAAFTSKSLRLKEDSIALAPWRLTVCGDFVRDMSAHATPLEAAALSGLEAGERTASFFQQQEVSPAKL